MNLERILLAANVSGSVVCNVGNSLETLFEGLAEEVIPDKVELLGNGDRAIVLVCGQCRSVSVVDDVTLRDFRGVGGVCGRRAAAGTGTSGRSGFIARHRRVHRR